MTAALVASMLFAIAAPLVLYPLALWLRSICAPDPVAGADITPRVSLIICAHDEAASIGARLDNAVALDYPDALLDIVVASDGSRDATVEIARRYAERGVRVLDLPRRGKAHALARAVESSEAGILAFSDANSLWERNALRALVRPFADPRVGGVAGDQRYVRVADDAAATGERSYWSFDRAQKRWQSRAGSVISATGAIYAVRRECFEAPPADATDDFMVSTGVVARGRRLVFAEDAIAKEPPAPRSAREFRRKVRVTTRGLRAVGYRRALLDPVHGGVYAFQLLLHKLWRRLLFVPLVGLLCLVPACWNAGGALAAIGLGIAGIFGLGALGLVVPAAQRLRPIAVASYLLLVNAACAVASFDVLRGHRVSHWEPDRRGDGLTEPLP